MAVSALFSRKFSLPLALSLTFALTAVTGLAAEPGPTVHFEGADDGSGEASLEIQVPPVRWESAGVHVRPAIEGFGRLGAVGSPDVPARRERIAIPADGHLLVTDVRVDWSEGLIPGSSAAYPALDPDAPELDVESWSGRGYWPEQPVRVSSQNGGFRGLRFATLRIAPVQVDIASGRFRVARRIVVELDRGPMPANTLSSAPRRDRLADAVGGSIAHGSGQVGWADRSPRTTESTTAEAASFPAWQFEVEQAALYRITYAWAESNQTVYPGLLDFLTSHDPRQYSMTVQGTEIPILVEGEADGSFDPPSAQRPEGDAIVFYGQPVDADILDTDVWQSGDFTDDNIYRLEIATGPSRVESVQATPQGVDPVPPSFPETIHFEPDVRFQGFISENGVDHWYDYPWLNTDADVEAVDWFVPTPGHAGGEVTLRARLHSFKAPDLHRTEVHVDDELVDGCGDGDNGCVDWDGFREFTHGVDQGPVTFDKALSATTKITFSIPLGRGVDFDRVMVNWVELDYDRVYEADQARLSFSSANEDREIHVAGFSEVPEIWDLSRTTTTGADMEVPVPRRMDGVSLVGSEARFEIAPDSAVSGDRRFVAAASSGYLEPDLAREDLPPSSVDSKLGDSLKGDGLGADWVVIGKRELLLDEAGSSLRPQLQALVDQRTATDAQNLETAVIDVQDVYDEFSYGIEEPEALRRFLAHAIGDGAPPCSPGWSPAPSYVLLLGDGTWDHKNNYGYDPPRQLMPTYMFDITANTQFGHYPSDTWFTAVCGEDAIPDATVGRIAAHDPAESEEAIRKILQYENSSDPGSITAKGLLVSEYEDGAEGPFFSAHDKIYDRWFAGQPQEGEKIYEQGTSSADAEDANARIDSAINAGAGIMSFAGHGGYQSWGKSFSIYRTRAPGATEPDDLEDINEDVPLVFTVQANCITGNFSATSSPESSSGIHYSFLEDWLTTARKGIASGFAPAHLTFENRIESILDPVYEEIFGREKERAVAVIDARLRQKFDTLNDVVNLRSFMLHGDPAGRLSMPSPPKPDITNIDKAGSGELLIQWTVPDDPSIDRFRIYRSSLPQGDYVLAGETASASAREFLDEGLRNCSEYFYYVVSVDSEGFESRWSNYNETCGGTGEDCASGVPENPDPPTTPTLNDVIDTERGGEVEVFWTQVPDDDVVEYRVRWGTEPGTYFGEKIVGAANSSTLVRGLENETRYYFAVQSAHCSQASAPSNEKSAVPHLVKGLNPPDSMRDLMVYRDGADLRLEWTLPQQSVWGTDTTVQGVKVYGSDVGPAFPTDSDHLLADLPGSATSWSHTGQGSAGSARWHYLVVATDVNGEVSASGVELPAGIDDLDLRKAGGGSEIEMTWTKVTESMDGDRLAIASYDLYGRNEVLPREQITPGDLVAGDIPEDGFGTTRSVTVPMPGASIFTYQMLAKDHHGTQAVW
jgi:hypothetical protein